VPKEQSQCEGPRARIRRAHRKAALDLPHHPRPGEVGNETWENDSWSYTGNAGVWAQMTIDDELGMVYLPVETPTGDEYGGHRPGNGLFGESLVALDLKTGKRVWHYQLIHHGIWDWEYSMRADPHRHHRERHDRSRRSLSPPSRRGYTSSIGSPASRCGPSRRNRCRRPTRRERRRARRSPSNQARGVRSAGHVASDIGSTSRRKIKAEAIKIASRYKMGPIYTPQS
jgi:quinoprotein glucose dehydrogenase